MKKLLATAAAVIGFAATGLVGIAAPPARSDYCVAHYALRTTAAPYQWVQACDYSQAVRNAAVLLARTPAYGIVTIDHVTPGTGDDGSSK